MNRTINKILMILMFVLIYTLILGNGSKNRFTLSFTTANYISAIEQNHDWDFGSNLSIRPGTELIYFHNYKSIFEIGGGFNFQLGKTYSYINNYERRFKFIDICFPILIRKNISFRNLNILYLTTGIYFGKTKNIVTEYPVSSGWIDWPENVTIENYSKDNKFSDLYFDLGLHSSLKKSISYSVGPYLKYRLNKTWLNYHQNSIHFGIKLSLILNK